MQRVRVARALAESNVACAAESAWPSTWPPKTYFVPMSRLCPRNRLFSSRSSDNSSMSSETGEVMGKPVGTWPRL